MGGLSIWHLMIVALVVFVLFGKGRISDLMEDVGKGIKSFKKGVSDDEPASLKPLAPPLTQVEQAPPHLSAVTPPQGPTAAVVQPVVTPASETH